MTAPQLPLDNLEERHPGLLASTAANYLDADRVCLDCHHSPPDEFQVSNDDQTFRVLIDWRVTDDRTRNAWANQNDVTRDGAYAIALAALELCRGLVAIRRAETRTGADYYVMPVGADPEDLESCYRLEVSGTYLGRAEMRRRLWQKVAQALRGQSNLPAIAAVVGFREKLVMIQTAEESP